MTRRPIFATTLISLLLLGAPAAAETIEKHYDETFAVEAGARLRLEHGDGDVVIRPWDRAEIAVSVHYRAETTRIGFGRIGGFEATFEQHGDTVTVRGREGDTGGVGIFTRNRDVYRYDIQAPSWVALDLAGDDGEVEIEGMSAAITVQVDDGRVRLHRVSTPDGRIRGEDGEVVVEASSGTLTIETDDGEVTVRDSDLEDLRITVADADVSVDGSRGDLAITSDDGDVRVRDVRGGRVELETEDGEIRVSLAPGAAVALRAESDDGDIDVRLAEGLGATFDVAMDDGDVDIDVRGAEVRRDRHRVAGTVGDRRADLEITTADGRVTLGRSR